MTTAIISDTHFHNHKYLGGEKKNGKNARLTEQLRVLREVQERFRATSLVVAGDVFDTDSPEPSVVRHVMDVFHSELFGFCRSYLMRGNHDAYSEEQFANCLSPLAYSEGIAAVDMPSMLGTVWMVPWGFHPVLKEMTPPSTARVVVAHHGIWGEETPSFMRATKDAVSSDDVLAWCDMHGIEYYFAGDWHQHASYHGGRVVQIGALCPLSFANPGIHGYGTVIRLENDPNRALSYEIDFVPGPRFVTAESAEALPALPQGCTGYARVKRAGKVPAGYVHVEVDEGTSPAAEVERVAIDTTSPDTVAASLRDWIANDAATPAGKRDEVFARAVQLLEQGRS